MTAYEPAAPPERALPPPRPRPWQVPRAAVKVHSQRKLNAWGKPFNAPGQCSVGFTLVVWKSQPSMAGVDFRLMGRGAAKRFECFNDLCSRAALGETAGPRTCIALVPGSSSPGNRGRMTPP